MTGVLAPPANLSLHHQVGTSLEQQIFVYTFQYTFKRGLKAVQATENKFDTKIILKTSIILPV